MHPTPGPTPTTLPPSAKVGLLECTSQPVFFGRGLLPGGRVAPMLFAGNERAEEESSSLLQSDHLAIDVQRQEQERPQYVDNP